MASALYNLATGVIQSTVSPSLSNAAQIASLKKQGIGVLEIPDNNTNGSNSIVDLASGVIVPVTPTPAIPNLLVQLVAAQINSGTLPSSAFHPASLAEAHAQLTAASLTGISPPAG